MLCCCPYKERIVRQTTIARTPNLPSVDDCSLGLPPRLWQPRHPEGGEAIVIEDSLTFPHSCSMSQLDAVLRPTAHMTPWGVASLDARGLIGRIYVGDLAIY